MATPPAPNQTGLTQAEALRRLSDLGPNELARSAPTSIWHLLKETLSEPMFQLLIGAGIIYVVLGDLGEASMLLAFVILTVGISLVQASRTERVLEALRDLSSPRALVIRDGVAQRIAGREVVEGDLLLINEGDRVPADAQLMEAHDIQTDESMLTGESVPVDVGPGDAVVGATVNAGGRLVVRATRVGADTQLAQMANSWSRRRPARRRCSGSPTGSPASSSRSSSRSPWRPWACGWARASRSPPPSPPRWPC